MCFPGALLTVQTFLCKALNYTCSRGALGRRSREPSQAPDGAVSHLHRLTVGKRPFVVIAGISWTPTFPAHSPWVT